MRRSKSLSAVAGALATILSLTTAPVQSAQPVDHHPPTLTAAEANKPKPKTKLKIAPGETVVYVADLHCKHCAKKIASKMYTVKGVVKVRTDLLADVVVVTPQAKKKLDPLALWTAAQKSGFPALKLEGPSGTYVPDPKTKTATRLPDEQPAPKS